MTAKREVDISTLIEQGDAVRDAIRRGGLETMKMHIRAGESMVSWKDGKVVHIPPAELEKMLAEAEDAMPSDMPEPYRLTVNDFDVGPFHELIKRLRHPEFGCPWDASRTLLSMGEPLLDEAREAAEALAADDPGHQCEELGDVLLNVMLATVIAEERGLFTWRDVVEGVSAKIVRRHPHVFGGIAASSPEEAMRMFLAAKAKEKEGKSRDGR